MKRLASLILSLLLLPALCACGAAQPQARSDGSDPERAVSDNPGAPREALGRAVEALFAEDAPGQTQALVVMYRGRIVAERYAEGFGPDSRFLGWSLAKPVTALAIGMLVAEGKLRLDESPPIPHWQRPGDPRGDITLRQLLQMRSGLRHVETSEPPYRSDTARLLFLDGRDDMGAQAEAQPLEAEPGSQFDYSTASTIVLADIAARVLSKSAEPARRQAAMHDFLESRLFGPARLESMAPEFDAAGTMVGGAMIWANARDWGRLGELLRNGGAVRGIQLVPRRWIEFMREPSPRAPDFGAQLWLNRESGSERMVLFPERGGSDIFAAAGHRGQYVIVSPRRQLTVVRFGLTEDEDTHALVGRLADLFALYPE